MRAERDRTIAHAQAAKHHAGPYGRSVIYLTELCRARRYSRRMASGDELRAARAAYDEATVRYAQAAAAVHTCLREGRCPSQVAIQREQDAKAVLEAARQRYLDAWMLP
jgi:hypothetical protein